MTQGCKIDKQDATYFMTFTVVDWIYLFHQDKYKLVICDSLNYCVENKGLEIYSYVIMSTHMHLVAAASNGNLSNVIRDFKKYTSGTILNSLKSNDDSKSKAILNVFSSAAAEHSRNKNYQLWKYGNHPVELYSHKFTLSKIKYIHNNPVKAGMVSRPQDYLYSSAVDYAGGESPVNVTLLNLDSMFS